MSVSKFERMTPPTITLPDNTKPGDLCPISHCTGVLEISQGGRGLYLQCNEKHDQHYSFIHYGEKEEWQQAIPA